MYGLNSDVYIAEYRNYFETINFFVEEYLLTFSVDHFQLNLHFESVVVSH